MANPIVDTGARAADFILWEEDANHSRDAIVIKSGSGVVLPGTVLGKESVGAASSAAKSGGNTGNGTFVLDATTPVRAGAKLGVYTLRAITAAANGGTFELRDPDGFALGTFAITGGAGGTVTVDNDIKGVLTDAGTDFIVGDGFDITIGAANAGAAKWVPSPATGVSGSQIAAGLNIYLVDATSQDVRVAAITRISQVNRNIIRYDASVNDDTKKGAKWAQLAQVGILVR